MIRTEQYLAEVGTDIQGDPHRRRQWMQKRSDWIRATAKIDDDVLRFVNWCQAMGYSEREIEHISYAAVIVECGVPQYHMNVDNERLIRYWLAQREYAEMNGSCCGCSDRWHDTDGLCRRTRRECVPYLVGPLFECYGQINAEVES